MDLNCLWVTSLISLHAIIPNQNYLEIAEKFYEKIEKKFCTNSIFHSYSENISFIEDYAYLIQCLLDLSDSTMNPKYRLAAKKYCDEAIEKFSSVKYTRLANVGISVSLAPSGILLD